MFVECDYDMYFIKLFNRMKLISKIKIKIRKFKLGKMNMLLFFY